VRLASRIPRFSRVSSFVDWLVKGIKWEGVAFKVIAYPWLSFFAPVPDCRSTVPSA
jgi:hypothetical protein